MRTIPRKGCDGGCSERGKQGRRKPRKRNVFNVTTPNAHHITKIFAAESKPHFPATKSQMPLPPPTTTSTARALPPFLASLPPIGSSSSLLIVCPNPSAVDKLPYVAPGMQIADLSALLLLPVRPTPSSSVEEEKQDDSSNPPSVHGEEEEEEEEAPPPVRVLPTLTPHRQAPRHFTFDDIPMHHDRHPPSAARQAVSPPTSATAAKEDRPTVMNRVRFAVRGMRSPTHLLLHRPSPSSSPTNHHHNSSSNKTNTTAATSSTLKDRFGQLHKRAAHNMAMLSPKRGNKPPAPQPLLQRQRRQEQEEVLEEVFEYDDYYRMQMEGEEDEEELSPSSRMRMVGRLSQRLSGFSELEDDEDVRNMDDVLRPYIDQITSNTPEPCVVAPVVVPAAPAPIKWSEMSHSEEWL
ncbi:hypothetical protein BASA81_003076 [Batrachochytrium salamandrivorans]|nr:hypothetical protein BASA81_003076 [Batrachochytrium salamandrivorans]